LSSIAKSAKRMGTLIDNLLAFSRMGRAELRQTPVAMDDLVQSVLRDLQPEMAGKNIVWQIAALPQVEGDREMLRQVWSNLISNAVKYSAMRDPLQISIGCRTTASEVEFFVRDNGIGFDMKEAHKLFGVFERLHQGADFEGTGIGLANVRRIILRHGGRTWADGELNVGATFYFSLPLMPKAA
jgi:light-regulated signal transduction histidine kinase (bacteriophytochrome)